jgi:hypothetical protein
MSGLSVWGGLDGGDGSPTTVKARTIIRRVYQMLGVIRSGQFPSSDQYADGLDELNQLVDSWATERLTIPQIMRDVTELQADVQAYNIPDQPPILAAALLTLGSTTESPLPKLGADPRLTQLPGAYADGSMPESSIVISPAPAAGDQLVIYRWRTLDGFGDLDTEVSVPNGYSLAIRFGLADQMSPAAMAHAKSGNIDLGKIERKAAEYKARIKTRNAARTPLDIEADTCFVSRDIRRWYIQP